MFEGVVVITIQPKAIGAHAVAVAVEIETNGRGPGIGGDLSSVCHRCDHITTSVCVHSRTGIGQGVIREDEGGWRRPRVTPHKEEDC